MRRVAIAGAADLPCGQRWDASAGDLAVEVAGELAQGSVDALFVAAPSVGVVDGQANAAALFADRLGLTRAAAYGLDAGDASGAAALHAAYAHVAAGLADTALVLGVAKVSDRSEAERAALLDRLIDREAEGVLGLTYEALAGLLADAWLTRHGAKRSSFAQVVAKNAANAVAGGESFHKHAPKAREIVRDLPVAPPLVRSDFAPLYDGATAVLVTELGRAKELTERPVEVLSVSASSDTANIADRADPLVLGATKRASEAALQRAGVALDGLAWLDVHGGCSIVEVLTLESIGVCAPGTTGALYADGFGRLGAERPINPGGAAQGRGLSFGVGGIDQAREAFLQVSGAAGGRQVADIADRRALALAISGLGAQCFATVFGAPDAR